MQVRLPCEGVYVQEFGGHHSSLMLRSIVNAMTYVNTSESIVKETISSRAIDFMGPINPLVHQISVRYIITTIEYLTRWFKVMYLKDFIVEMVARLIF
jgi:hypothetical protein